MKNVSRITIKESSISAGTGSETTESDGGGDPIVSNPTFPSGNPGSTADDDEFTTVETDGTETVNTNPSYIITADKTSAKEGDFITYTTVSYTHLTLPVSYTHLTLPTILLV